MESQNYYNRIFQIILKEKLDIATDEELFILNKWKAYSEENEEMYRNLKTFKTYKEHIQNVQELDETTDFRKLNKNIKKVLGIRRNILLLPIFRIAVSIALIVVMGYFLFRNNEKKESLTMLSVDETPYNVVLVVKENGEKIIIPDSTNKKDLRVRLSEDNELVFFSEENYETILDETREPEILHIVTTTGADYSFLLPDGSRVWLNSLSELEFPEFFQDGERVVRLKGEAFFEVMADASNPFIVETGDVKTMALGTKFNIRNYPEDKNIYTTLICGVVSVSQLEDLETSLILNPGESAVYSNKNIVKQKLDVEMVTAWMHGLFLFKNENLEVVFKQIERWYGVQFIYSKEIIESNTITGNISKDQSLEDILQTLTFIGGPEFRIEDNNVYVK